MQPKKKAAAKVAQKAGKKANNTASKRNLIHQKIKLNHNLR